jgi:hypothetical protein
MSALDGLAKTVGGALEPLSAALTDPRACERLLRDLGWSVPISQDTLAEIADLLPVLGLVRQVPEKLDQAEDGSAVAVLELIEIAAEVFPHIKELGALEPAAVEELPGALGTPEAWADIAAALPGLLLSRRLAGHVPALHGVLRLLGLSVSERIGPIERERLVFDGLGAVLADPAEAVRGTVGWSNGDFQAWPLQRELGRMLSRLGLPVHVRQRRQAVCEAIAGGPVPLPTGLETDVVLFSGTTPAGGLAELGLIVACAENGEAALYVGNRAYGEFEAALPVGDSWTVTAAGSVDGTATVGVLLQPSGLSVVGGDVALGASLTLEGEPEEPWILVGGSGGPRLELAHAALELGVEGTVGAPEAYVLLRIDEGAFRLVLDLGAADSFLRGVIAEPPVIDAGGELRWGSESGLRIGGGVGLTVTLAIERQAGPFYIESLSLAVGGSDAGASLAATTIGSLTIGPFKATVEDIGASLELVPAPDGFAGLDAQVAFVPPTAVGLELELEGASGAGYIWIDHEAGRYAGALELDFLALGLSAVVVVDTRLPDDPDGWALFCSLSLTFPQVPLGFGFFLEGVGGIVCLNRTLDAEALAGGLKSGAVDAILFPENALADAALIVSQLDSWFPLSDGSLVLGVAGRITWGTPKTIVTGDIGVVLSFPELDFAVLGSITMELPEEEPVLELHMDTLGSVDLSEGTVLVAASLYDSSLLNTISLSGDMAMYARFGDDPYFLFSVGGYHPDFEPPGGLPAVVTDLDRMRVEVTLSEDVWYALEAYVAVTSNTLQFGSQASLEASVGFLGTTYTARGAVGFDVLLVFSPFSFSAHFEASVSVTAGNSDNELLAVALSAHLEGPKPWYASGQASFDFFGINVPFNIEVGGAAAVEAPEGENVLDSVVAALRDASAWRGVPPAGAAPAVLLAEAGGEGLPARPDAELEAVQSVAPLERTIDRYGIYEVLGPDRLDITGASIGGQDADWEHVHDWFAPAQYDDMSRNEKLGAPSYEQMVAGVRFGTSTVTAGDAPGHTRTVTPVYESKILDIDRTHVLDAQPIATDLASATAALRLDGTRRRLSGRTVSSPSFRVGPTAWTTADAVTGEGRGLGTTYREALADRHAAGPSVRVAPTYAVLR